MGNFSRSQMPTCKCTTTGKTFTPHVVMSTSSIFNRQTMGQLAESFTGASVMNLSGFDPLPIHHLTQSPHSVSFLAGQPATLAI